MLPSDPEKRSLLATPLATPFAIPRAVPHAVAPVCWPLRNIVEHCQVESFTLRLISGLYVLSRHFQCTRPGKVVTMKNWSVNCHVHWIVYNLIIIDSFKRQSIDRSANDIWIQ